MNKEELDQFVINFEKKQISFFDELEGCINAVDLSNTTKKYLIEIMNKDINRTFGFVEQNLSSWCRNELGEDKEC